MGDALFRLRKRDKSSFFSEFGVSGGKSRNNKIGTCSPTDGKNGMGEVLLVVTNFLFFHDPFKIKEEYHPKREFLPNFSFLLITCPV